MDEFLSEKEQIEQIREWWRENGWYLIGGAVVAALGYFGYGQYRAYQDRIASEASALYSQMQQLIAEDRPGSDALLDQLVRDFGGTPYADQARLLFAREHVVSDPERASSELRAVMETSEDPQLAMVARLRLARVLAYRNLHDDALTVLDVAEPGEFEAQFLELRGDIHAAGGAADDARRAYTEAFTARGAEGLDRNLLQMKIGDLSADGPVPAAAPQTSAPATAIETPATDGAVSAPAPDDGAAAGTREADAPAGAAGAGGTDSPPGSAGAGEAELPGSADGEAPE